MAITKLSFFFIFFLLCTPVNTVLGDEYSEAQALIDQSTVVLKTFHNDTSMEGYRSNVQYAKAVFIIPQMLKAGFFLGGSGGSGALLSRDIKTNNWSYPVFYTMGSVSFGLQFGGEASSIILLVMTDKGMDSLLTTSFKLGADVTVAAGPVGQGVKAATTDILAFASAKGAFVGLSIEGAIIKPRNKWNSAYYKKQVSPADVVIRNAVSNPNALELRRVITEQGKLKTTKVSY